MTICANEEKIKILAKLEELGFSSSEVTGKRHSIPKPIEILEENNAISLIKKEARENKKYYLEKAKENKNPWFHNVKNKKQYSEFILVSPAMAEELLSWNNNPRKKIMQTVVDRYRIDMEQNEWNDNSQSIAIDYKGYMHNGQHRLTAIVQSKREQRLYFTFNTLISAREDEDVGAPRKPAVQIELKLHNRIGNKLPAICRSAIRGSNGQFKRISQSQLATFAEIYGAQIEWIERICPTHRSDVIAALLKAVLWYGSEKMEPFLKRFGDVLFESKNDPARLLHSSLKAIKGNKSRLNLYRKTLSAIDVYVKDRSVSKLVERSKDIFEWEDDFKIPQKK